MSPRRGVSSTAGPEAAFGWTAAPRWWETGYSAAWTKTERAASTWCMSGKTGLSARRFDTLVFIAANTNPVTDPFLVDRFSVIAAEAGCELVVCVNKTDIDPGDRLCEIFANAGFPVVRTSAETGAGVDALLSHLKGKISAFSGNSGVGKSSILNVLLPDAHIKTGEVSEKLGRGRHTTRHVELYSLGGDTYIADTPGFASLDVMMTNTILKENLQYDFPDFAPYLGTCRFHDCAHLKEPGCAVTAAVAAGEIGESRYSAYVRLYEMSAQHKFWEYKDE